MRKYLQTRKRLSASFLALMISLIGAIPVFAADETEKNTVAQEWAQTAADYGAYLSACETAAPAGEQIIIEAVEYISDVELQEMSDYEGDRGVSVILPDSGSVSWHFNVEQDGLFQIKFDYYSAGGSGSAALRDILIDGELPFAQSAEIIFEQPWGDTGTGAVYDSAGNELRPAQERQYRWLNVFARDSSGFISDPLEYFLKAGEHTLTLAAKRENLYLRRITLCREKSAPSYAEVSQEYENRGYKPVRKESLRILETEAATSKSDKTLYPLTDRTSPTVSPYHPGLIRYNTIGGSQWQTAGQWIEWEIDVSEDGLYYIAARFKQSQKVNDISVRELTIDGKLPFTEAADLPFAYGSGWQNTAFGDRDGNPYLFYLSRGPHTIRLRAVLGSGAALASGAKALLTELNRLYREIVVVTGASPDQYRDYQLDSMIPETIADMNGLYSDLKKLESKIEAYNKTGGQSTAAIKRLYIHLKGMLEDTDTIARRLSSFKENISAFGTWLNSLSTQPLELDTLTLLPPGEALTGGEAGIFRLLGHYLTQFAYSFITDYASVGVTDIGARGSIRVWTASGRDQSQILKQMINDEFTPSSDISVNLQLVSASALLPSVVAGVAPDVYMGMLQSEPVNLALRGALADLSGMKNYGTVAERFYKEATVPFEYNGGIYGLPETISYQMLFYRSDILASLGISKSSLELWDTILKDVLPELQINSLMFGVTSNSVVQYLLFLYQEGGSLYQDGGRSSGMNTPQAVAAMKQYSVLYTQYGMPLSFDFANRFRTGDVPLGISEFTMYNQLTVFAPEIRGLWGMMPVPATRRADGAVDRSAVAAVTASVILQSSARREESWEFLEWWSRADTQDSYGSGIESVVGAAARYNSANIEALERVQWDYDTKQNLMEQLDFVRAYPEVPGGYLTPRSFTFAFRDIVYQGEDIRQTLSTYAGQINQEIINKREEFNLD